MGKQENLKTVEDFLGSAFWRQPHFSQLFADEIEILFPYAPPGMPTYFDSWETGCCFEWLNRTVRDFHTDVKGLYGTPYEEEFWSYGSCTGDVHWANQDGEFHSEYIARLTVHNGKIRSIKLQMDPLAFYKAAHIEVPVFKMDIYDPEVDKLMEIRKNSPSKKKPADNREPNQRLSDNLNALRCWVKREEYRSKESVAVNFDGDVWWVPPEMTDLQKSLDLFRRSCWTKASSPWMYRNPSGVIHPTDDPHVFFAEMQGRGPARWLGNHNDGHYHQSYFIIVKFNDQGELTYMLEPVNPINKFNCENISIPTFPYYM